MEEDNPFENVLVDEESYSKEILANTVAKYVKIGRQQGRLIPEDDFQDLNSKRKIIVSLLAQKIRFELGMVDDEWLGPTRIAEMTGLKKGTVYPSVRDLDNEGLLDNDDGKYRVPVVKINEAKNYLEK